MSKIIIPAILSSYRPLADKSFNLTFNTNILNPEQKVIIDSFHQHYGFLMFKDTEVEKVESEQFDNLKVDIYDAAKSPSQRLRWEIHQNFLANNEGFQNKEDHYKATMEKVINHFRNKR